MTRSLLFIIILVLAFLGAQPCLMAGSCQYGTAEAWVRTDNGAWMPATHHPRLHPGDTLELVVRLNASIPLAAIFCELHEFGTPVYEVLKGPSSINELVCQGATARGRIIWHRWQIRVLPETNWINSTAPLELFVQFTRSNDESRIVTFDALCGIIERPLAPLTGQYDTSAVPLQPIEPIPLALTAVLIIISLRSHLKKHWYENRVHSVKRGKE
jgi:hypothetical protein